MRYKMKIEFFTALALLLSGGYSSPAQATPTAHKDASVDAFATYGRANTDFGDIRNNVITVGGDFMLKPIWGVQPGINGRYVRSSGELITQGFIGGGLDLRFKTLYHIRPFAVIDYGHASVENVGGLDDSGSALLFGGGVDIPIISRFAARAEFNYQKIHISGGGVTPDLSFTPYNFSIGVVYQIR